MALMMRKGNNRDVQRGREGCLVSAAGAAATSSLLWLDEFKSAGICSFNAFFFTFADAIANTLQ